MNLFSPLVPILMIGLNHKVAPLEVRERLAFGADHIQDVLKDLLGKESACVKEAALLSTCNRSELYICPSDAIQAEARLFDFLASHAGLPADQLQTMVYVMRSEEAAQHLMRVSAGLDSLVLGENEILGQVRSAGDAAQAAGTTGPFLSALFRYAIQAGKRARAETGISQGNISIASIVVELAEQAFGSLNDRTALLIGAGKISAITARALVRAGLRCIMVANRTFERAQILAGRLNGKAVHFSELEDVLTQADIVICSTGAPHIVLHEETVAKAQLARNQRPLLVADLAVPRDADPKIAFIPGVQLANIDDLETVIQTDHVLTASVCQDVQQIILQELSGFRQWCGVRRCAPVIQAIHNKAESIYQAEVEQTLRRLGALTPRQERLVKAMGKAIAGKILHEPTIRLRELSPDDDITTYLDLIQDIYGIQ